MGAQPVYVIHGDVLADINLTELAEFHEAQGREATMALTSVANPTAYGAVRLSGTKVVEFEEKPTNGPSVSRLINAGIYILNPSVLNRIPKPRANQPVFLEEDVFPDLVTRGELTGYLFEGTWFDISTPTEYERALKAWQK